MKISIPSAPFFAGPVTTASLRSGKAAEAAQQFENLLLSQMLKAGRESASILGGDDDDSETSAMLEVAEQQFAQVLAKNGGLGLSRVIARGLEASPRKH
jgi:Rod binding domain-containing protein